MAVMKVPKSPSGRPFPPVTLMPRSEGWVLTDDNQPPTLEDVLMVVSPRQEDALHLLMMLWE